MSTDPESKITEDGLRYKRKASGSPFPNIGSRATISCYKCGLHKPRSMGIFKKLINVIFRHKGASCFRHIGASCKRSN